MKKNIEVIERDKHYFHGLYKDQYITITKEKGDDDLWYIQVFGDGGYSYDGYWNGDSMDAAIQEALRGSEL